MTPVHVGKNEIGAYLSHGAHNTSLQRIMRASVICRAFRVACRLSNGEYVLQISESSDPNNSNSHVLVLMDLERCLIKPQRIV